MLAIVVVPFWNRRRERDDGVETEPRVRLAQLAQSGQEALARGEVDEMMALAEQGFALVEQHDLENDVCFVALVLVCGDGALMAGEVESAASMYKRAEDTLTALAGPDDVHGTQSTRVMLARTQAGLATADVARGYQDRAIERFRSALQILQDLGSDAPPHAISEVRDELARLDAG